MAPDPIRYDFNAAANLEQALGALVKRLQDFENTRVTQRTKNLGQPTGGVVGLSWRGGRRLAYEADYNPQMSTLKGLISQALAMQGKIVAATQDAARAKHLLDKTGGDR